jgi:hypothetical protein
MQVFMRQNVSVFFMSSLILLSAFCSIAFANDITLIPLNNANAAQLLPILEKQISPASSISVYQNQLVVNASAEETVKIKSIVEMLDGSGKQLLISVKNSIGSTTTSREISINNGNINDSGLQIIHGNPNSETRVTRTYQQRGGSSNDNNTQGIRATEGYPAYISTGAAMAYNQPALTMSGQVIQTQQWQQAQTGFYATAWVNGETVSISIEQQKQGFNSNTSINSQVLETRVSGKLGEWIALGAINQQQNMHNQAINSRSRSGEMQNNTIYLKVELAQ